MKDLQGDYESNCGKNDVVLRQMITVLIFPEGGSDLVVEQKWQMLQGAMEKCVWKKSVKLWTLQRVSVFSLGFAGERRKIYLELISRVTRTAFAAGKLSPQVLVVIQLIVSLRL